jgi:hypothetical protein
MNTKEAFISGGCDVKGRVSAIKMRIAASSLHPSFVAKVVHTSSIICKPDEFNIWHAASDGVKGNGGNQPWGTFGASPAKE